MLHEFGQIQQHIHDVSWNAWTGDRHFELMYKILLQES
jgi:hypothetical protein